MIMCVYVARAQPTKTSSPEPPENLQRRVQAFETEVNELKQVVKQPQAERSHNGEPNDGRHRAFDSAGILDRTEPGSNSGGPLTGAVNALPVWLAHAPSPNASPTAAAWAAQQEPSGTVISGIDAEDRKTLDFLRQTTLNHSRSFWFTFLPCYHMGARTGIPIGDRFSVQSLHRERHESGGSGQWVQRRAVRIYRKPGEKPYMDDELLSRSGASRSHAGNELCSRSSATAMMFYRDFARAQRPSDIFRAFCRRCRVCLAKIKRR